MTWEDFYDRQWNWKENTKAAKISSLADFSSSDEVVDVALCFCDSTNATLLVKKALQGGVRFTPDNIIDLSGVIDVSTLEAAIRRRNGEFTPDLFDVLEGCCFNDALLASVAKDAGIKRDDFIDENVEQSYSEDIAYVQPIRPRIGLFSLIAQLADDSSRRMRNTGKCNGDCANCPDHYDYRYGRWYYGKHHSSGCEFGGNDCSGKP